MITVLKNSWALLAGMFLLMLGNGLQGTLLGVRGAIEGFSASQMSWIMSAYFIGFLFGSRTAPELIRRVGHVRVFAALASFISAAFILFPAWPNEYFWFVLRIIVGFCFSGVYVVAESWLNDSAENETRGKTLSLYLIVQMMGIVLAQAVLNFADPSGFLLFVVISVLVSLSFAPILLSISPAPMFQTTKPMKLLDLYKASPLGIVGIFLLGGVFAALFGMAPVYGTQTGLTVGEISMFIASIYLGGMLLQYPIGWISDRMDRRVLIIFLTASCAAFVALSVPFLPNFYLLLGISFIIGGIANPLYSLLIAYTNDFLDHDDMAAASGGLIFVNGIGAIGAPMVIGFLMDQFGSNMFFFFVASLMGIMALYASYRSTQRAAVPVDETGVYTPLGMQASQVTLEVAQEYAIEQDLEEEAMRNDITEVIDFWLTEVPRENWYNSTTELDEEVRERFLDRYNQAVEGELEAWENSANGSLALLLLLDQFSRNMFRGDAQSFAADAQAREIADRAISSNYDEEFDGPERQFFYLPFMHSEDLADQDRAVTLYDERSNKASGTGLHARVHREVIRTYGRFPYRNKALGRESTEAEQEFLNKGGYAALVRKMKAETPK